jgi:general secretion pathway protein D
VSIREVLELLDVQPQLIAIDITISEIRTPENQGFLFGFQIPFALGNSNDDLVGFVRSDPSVGGTGAIPTITGRIQRDTGVAFETIQNGIPVTVPILQSGTIAAVDFEGTNEVLIQPSLIVTAGDQHEIFVGSNVPIPVTENAGFSDGSTVAGVNTNSISRTTRFDRRDIGTRLAIEVVAGKKGKIQLDLEIELSALDTTRAALGGDPAEVGPSFIEQHLVVKARLEDGETAVLAVNNKKKETRIRSGVPFFRDLPVVGFLFQGKGRVVEDIRLIIAARARRVSNPAELVADTIRRRLVFERRNAREAGLPQVDGSPYGVRVTTRQVEEYADAIADSLSFRGLSTVVHGWNVGETDYYDVYVTDLPSMVDAASLAQTLSEEGWEADLVVMSTRS